MILPEVEAVLVSTISYLVSVGTVAYKLFNSVRNSADSEGASKQKAARNVARTRLILLMISFGLPFVFVAIIPPPGNLWFGRYFAFLALLLSAVISMGLSSNLKSDDPRTWTKRLFLVGSVISTIAGVTYWVLISRLRVHFDNDYLVIGIQLRPEIERAHKSNSPSELLLDAAGQPELIWTTESIEAAKWMLACAYAILLSSTAFATYFLLLLLPATWPHNSIPVKPKSQT